MDYFLGLACNSGIFIILAMGLHLINGACGQLSLGHAGFWAVGGYIGGAYALFFAPEYFPDFLNLFISYILGGIGAALAGLAIGLPCLRLRGDYLAIATLGFGEIIRIVIINLDVVGGPRGLPGIPKWSNVYWIYLWVVIIYLLLRNLLRSGHGRAIISIREDEIAAESMGINIVFYKTLAFVLGAGIAGLAGPLFAHYMQLLHPNGFTFMWSVIILLMVIMGGVKSLSGAVLGAILLSLLPEALRLISEDVSKWRMVIYSVLLIVFMLLRPQGILSEESRLFARKEAS